MKHNELGAEFGAMTMDELGNTTGGDDYIAKVMGNGWGTILGTAATSLWFLATGRVVLGSTPTLMRF